MTNDELATYYAKLLIAQYLDQPQAYATILASVPPFIMEQLPVAVQGAYDIETAVGVQLDVLGKYIGVTRDGYTFGSAVTLDDSDYRQLIKMVLIKNNSGSSLATIEQLLAKAFPGQVFVSDSQDMTLSYTILESLGTSDLLEILVTGGYMPAPMGVQVSVVIVPVHVFPFFGFRTYSSPDNSVAPFNSYPLYSTSSIWLSYSGVS